MKYLYIIGVLLIFIGLYLFVKIKSLKKEKSLIDVKTSIRNISISAVLMALAAILKVYSIMITDQMRISLFALPLILAGLTCGIEYGILAGLGADLVYSMFSAFPFNIAYTFSALFWGFLGGLFKLKKDNLKWYEIVIGIIVVLLIETHINLLSNLILYGKGTTLVLMFYKYVVVLIKIPVLSFLVWFLNERVIKKVNKLWKMK